MFTKLQVNYTTVWHNSDMNDNELNNKMVIWIYTQQKVSNTNSTR